ncbi:MAG: hypothetical protein ABI207_02985 [Crocinitomicaceae bacterium]
MIVVSNRSYGQVAHNTLDFYGIVLNKYVDFLSKIDSSKSVLNVTLYQYLNIDTLPIKSIGKYKINYITDNKSLAAIIPNKGANSLFQFYSMQIIDSNLMELSLLHFSISWSNKKKEGYTYTRYGTTTVTFKFNCELQAFEFFDFKYTEF